MIPPSGWQNPIICPAGQVQHGVDPLRLLPARFDLERSRFQFQSALLLAGKVRFTPIRVNLDAVIFDGHHAVRAAAEEGRLVDVLVVDQALLPTAASIMDLPWR